MTSRGPSWQRLYAPRYIATAGVILGWLGVFFAYQGDRLGVILALVTTLLVLLALRRGEALSRGRRESLRSALEMADTRNRELERLGAVTATMLQDVDLPRMFQTVADSARDLLQAEGALIALLVEEGRFLKVMAAGGAMEGGRDQLIPTDASLSGWALNHDEAVVTDDLYADPRSTRVPGVEGPVTTAAVIPLRSAGVPIGTMSVINRRDNLPFDRHDLQLLRNLGDQAVVALDRARIFEEIRGSQRELTQKNAELLRAARLKGEFLANMSHELRTPLNAIIGFSDLILSGGVGAVHEVHREFLEAVLRNGRHLLGLINDVLDLSKIEAGRMSLMLAGTDVREAITGAVADTASLRTGRRQQCEVHLDEEPLRIVADGVRVRQVLFNLLSNASKFTPEQGRITLSAVRTTAPLPAPAGRAGEEASLISRDAVWIAVSDTGIGIRQEDFSALFQEFSQLDSSASRQQQGTGLGLALSRRFVELHGGVIGVESIVDKGSTFWFILPTEGPVRRGSLRNGVD
ncbi:MAG TPA: ATP-binding protein [Gemmatimonadales bacterium]|nr:ATP-binding protein [Gemmatimonadales bacterium]